MRIALDYDDTFTEDREGWSLFVHMMRNRGHDVTFVTFRMEPDKNPHNDCLDIIADSEALGIPIVYTNHRQKKHVFNADVWIDDSPVLIADYKEMRRMVQGCEINNDTVSDFDVL